MKTIPNLTFTVKDVDTKKETTTAILLKMTLGQPPESGFDFNSMRARLRIADLLDKAKDGDAIQLEDADFAIARKCVEDFRWQGYHADFIKFGELFGL